MKKRLNKNIKAGLMMAIVATALTGCGSSTDEEQLKWINTWKDNIDGITTMYNSCLKEANVRGNRISKQQKKIMNECEFSYITDKADDDGVSLDRETLEANILQF